jgi:hypothetical protein
VSRLRGDLLGGPVIVMFTFLHTSKKKKERKPDWKFQIDLVPYNFTDVLSNSFYVSDDIEGLGKIAEMLIN